MAYLFFSCRVLSAKLLASSRAYAVNQLTLKQHVRPQVSTIAQPAIEIGRCVTEKIHKYSTYCEFILSREVIVGNLAINALKIDC